MKNKKKRAIVASFVIGTMLFASTAFAEINSKSGYDQLKDALKLTAESCTSKLSSYTVDQSMVIKDNGNIVYQDNELYKYDLTNGVRENKSSSLEEGKSYENYSYSDDNERINYNKEQNTYYITKFENRNTEGSISNPFKEKQASDVEKIADAIVGNLKDSVVVTQRDDGGKELSGSISEAQIPAIANALVSFVFKRQFVNHHVTNKGVNETSRLKIIDDIYVKEIKGDMMLDKTGLIESVMGTGTLSGKDENGKDHNITFELLVKIIDVNKTSIARPDLNGKKVETVVQKDYNKISKPMMFVGTYKNDIVLEKDNQFVKIGERIVEIKGLDDKAITGKYHEEYVKGYEEYASAASSFEFVSTFQDGLNSRFETTAASGKKISGSLWIDNYSPRIGFNLDGVLNPKVIYTGDYNRVFK